MPAGLDKSDKTRRLLKPLLKIHGGRVRYASAFDGKADQQVIVETVDGILVRTKIRKKGNKSENLIHS